MSLGLVLEADPFPPVPIGWAIVLAGSAMAGLALASVGRRRLPSLANGLLLAICGAGIGLAAGAIEQAKDGGVHSPDAHDPQWLAAIVILALLTPMHVRIVFGPLGRKT